MSMPIEMRGRIMEPEQLAIVRDVFRRLKTEGYLPPTIEEQQAFAAYVLKMYFRGLVLPEKLYALCVAAAKSRIINVPQPLATSEIHLPICKVLIVEDDVTLASSLKGVFQKAGAIVLGPVTGKSDAVELLDSEVPDLAVVDLNLGDSVTFGVIDYLRRQSVPFCIYSAHRPTDFPELAANIGGVQWLEKPALPQAVLRAAASALVTEV